jgi:hypothetical protein
VLAHIITKAKETGKETEGGTEISPFSTESLAHITGMSENKVKDYVSKLVQVNLVTLGENSLLIRGVTDLDDYLRYIALKEKFEKI